MSTLRVRAVALLSGAVLAAGLTAGCASGTGGSGDASRPAHDAVAAAYTETLNAGSAKITLAVDSGAAGSGVHITGSGVADFATRTSELTLTLPAPLGGVQMRALRDTLYLKLPAIAARQFGAATPWVELDLDTLAQRQLGTSLAQLGAVSSGNPIDMLSYLRGTGQQVRDLGPATLDGVATTQYAITIDLDKAGAGQPAAVRAAIARTEKQLGTHSLPGRLWIDAQGRMRQMTVTAPTPGTGTAAGRSVRITVGASDFGVPVHVAAPPSGQVTDVTSLLAGLGH